RCRRYNGEYAWLETVARRMVSDGVEQGTVVCATREVTKREQIEDAVRESDNRFRSALETIRLVAVGLDSDGRVTFCNDALCALTGWSRSELIGEAWFDRFVVDNGEARAAYYSHVTRGTVPPNLEYEIVCRDGSRRLIDWDNTILYAATGAATGTASLGADITGRRREERTLNLLHSITLGIAASTDLDAALAITLKSLCDATGWSYGEAWLPTPD